MPAAGAGRGYGRALHRGCRTGARVSRARRADGGAVRGRSVRAGRQPHVPHRRSGALARRWGAGLPRPRGCTAESARLPHRARRDRGGADAACRGGARPPSSRARTNRAIAPGRLRGGQRRSNARCVDAARACGCEPSGLHGAGGVRGAGQAAAHAQRQARPQGAAGARCHPCPGAAPAAHAAGGTAVRAVRRGARARARRHRRQLLRVGRPLVAGDATDQPHPRHASMSSSRSAACSRRRPWKGWSSASMQTPS